MNVLDLPERPRILVITLRRLGDVLLTTPLIRTVRRGIPQATLDVMVFRGGERILKGNPDIDGVITAAERPSPREALSLLRRLWRRYDLVISTQPGDRPTGFALAASRRRVGLVPRAGETGAWWKRHAYHVAVPLERDAHHVTRTLALATALGLPHAPDIVCPQGPAFVVDEIAPRAPYAVVHANPFYRYKRWTDAGWRALARGLAERGLAVVVTESRDPAERAYMESLWTGTDVIRERGRLDWAGLTALLKGAAVYVGPDTSVTHLAAGSGCPTVALYGPTSPRLHGPWPVGGLAEPWQPAGTIQHHGNVWVVQNPLPCLPCEKLGCAGHLDSHSRCLDELPTAAVLRVIDQALADRPKP
jgi:heptosyltransferase-3